MNQQLINKEKIALSSNQITSMLAKVGMRANIMTMTEVERCTSLNQIFKTFDHVVLFTATDSINSGHWQTMFLENSNLYFYDSYGKNLWFLINEVNVKIPNNNYKQGFNLGRLIQNSQYFPNRCFMNTYDYQRLSPVVNDCGRYVVSCLSAKKHCNNENKPFDFNVYYNIMNTLKQTLHLDTFDEVVSYEF